MADEAIVKVVRRYLQALVRHGIPVRFGVLFGSQASGHPDPGATLICWWCHPGLTTNAGGMT
jgi:hypothetical protein